MVPSSDAGRAWTLALTAAASLVCLQLHPCAGQDPKPHWKPNNVASLGSHCWNGAPNPNDPAGHHIGGCGCENTLMRLDGHLVVMESAGHGCDDVFPGYNSSRTGDCSYFRLRNQTTGMVIANVSESLQHSFCAAVADHARRQVWVFCSAHARNNKQFPGPCDRKPYRGCYVGAWNASFDNLNRWSPTRKALVLPDGYALFNNDVALVSGAAAAAAAALPGAAPAHQATMIMEGRQEDPRKYPRLSPFAVNTGTDGDLGANWVLLNRTAFTISGFPAGATGEGTGDAPTLRYDAEEGYYYSIGGGWITNGPARSPNLTAGSWEASTLAPMAAPDARLVQAGLPVVDSNAGDGGINAAMYTAVWRDSSPQSAKAWMANTSAWDWGVTDPDLCCSDGEGPSFLLNTLSRQGAPHGFAGKSTTFNRLQRSELPLNEWLRSYFPEDQPRPQP